MNLRVVKFCAYLLVLFFFNQAQPSSISFGSKYSTIKVDNGAFCLNESPLSIQNGVVNREEFGIIYGAPVYFDNATLIDCGNKAKLSGTIIPSPYAISLDGNDMFYGRNGIFNQPIYVSNKNNLIGGNLTLYNNITLQDSNASTSIDLISNLNSRIYLNGGMLCLMGNSLRFNDGQRIFGPGTIVESGSKLIYGSEALTFNEDMVIIEAEDIEFNAKTTLNARWTVSGSGTLDGKSNIFDLNENGKIVVERGSSLLLKNMNIYNLEADKISCLDNTSSITFQNVNFYLSSDFTFSTGKFSILDDVSVFGENKFIYQSPMQSMILSKSRLKLDNGVTFSYDPPVNRQDLIIFEDGYSTLALNGATLHATLTGMHLTKGCLTINNNSYITSEKNQRGDAGITFGNDNPSDDLYCQNLKGSTLELTAGSLKYRNVIPTSWLMEKNQSEIIINPGCNLFLYQNLNIEPGGVNYKGRGGFFYAPGKNVTGSLNVIGYIDYKQLN